MQSFKNVSIINLETSYDVEIVNTNKVTDVSVEISNDENNTISLNHMGNELIVKTPIVNNSTTFISSSGNNNVVISGNSTSSQTIVNGRVIQTSGDSVYIENLGGVCIGDVYVNGVKVSVDELACKQQESKKPILIKIWVPHEIIISLNATLNSSANLNCDSVSISNCDLRVDGSGDSKFGYLKNLNVEVEGRGNVVCRTLLRGKLVANINGRGCVDVIGEFSKVLATVNGRGDVKTNGIVRGDYFAVVSGRGNICHSGIVEGDVSKSLSGRGSILV